MEARLPQGVYCLANDKVIEWTIAFCESLRAHEPALPLVVIPFDDHVDRLSRLAERYRFAILRDPSLERLDRIGTLFYPGDPTARHMFRKLAAFWGPFDRFIFLDSNIVVLGTLGSILSAGIGYDLVRFDTDIKPVYKSGPFRDEMVRAHGARGFNAGAFISRRGALTLDRVEGLAVDALAVKDHFMPAGDQPFLNYCFDMSGLRMEALSDLIPAMASCVWAAQAPVRRVRGAYRVLDKTRPVSTARSVPLLHWAGYRCNRHIPNRTIYLRYRLRAYGTTLERLIYVWRFFESQRFFDVRRALPGLWRYLSRRLSTSARKE